MILKANPAAQVSLRMSTGGVFEIKVDGKLTFSKRATGDFPSDAAVRALAKA